MQWWTRAFVFPRPFEGASVRRGGVATPARLQAAVAQSAEEAVKAAPPANATAGQRNPRTGIADACVGGSGEARGYVASSASQRHEAAVGT